MRKVFKMIRIFKRFILSLCILDNEDENQFTFKRKQNTIMKFYEFTQNNSGGSFVVNNKLTHRLFIQAQNEDDACSIAEDMGVYFNGCDEGLDCECCGDRWYPRPSEVRLTYGTFEKAEADAVAESYGSESVEAQRAQGTRNRDVIFANVEAYAQYLADRYGWCKPDARIFYADGTVKEIFSAEKK